MRPCRIELDGWRVDVWLGWIGNCVYGPPGLAPAWREQLDDGLLDVRLVHGGRLARTRFVLAALIGRLSALASRQLGGGSSPWRWSPAMARLRLAADGDISTLPLTSPSGALARRQVSLPAVELAERLPGG